MRKYFIIILFLFSFLFISLETKANDSSYGKLITNIIPDGDSTNLVDSINGYEIEKIRVDSEKFGKNENGNFWEWNSISPGGGGFSIKIPESEKLNEEYTMALKFEYSDLSNHWKKIVDYKNKTSDNGFYFYNGYIVFYEGGNKGEKRNKFLNNQVIDLVITRFADGRFVIYSVKDGNLQKELDLLLDKNSTLFSSEDYKSIIGFFFDDNKTLSEASNSGKFYSLKIWNKAVEEKTIVDNIKKIVTPKKNFNYKINYYLKDTEENVPNIERNEDIGTSLEDDNITITVPSAPVGYKLVDGQSMTFQLTQDNIIKNIYYEIDEIQKIWNYKINYYLKDTEENVPNIERNTDVGTAYIKENIVFTPAKAPVGYKLVDGQSMTFQLTQDNTIKNIYYELDDGQKYNYIVEYKKNGEIISTLTKSILKANSTILENDIEDKTPKGYKIDANTSVIFPHKITSDNEKIIINYVIDNQDSGKKFDYEIHYLEENTTNEIFPKIIGKGYIGERIQIEHKIKNGYFIIPNQKTILIVEESENPTKLIINYKKENYTIGNSISSISMVNDDRVKVLYQSKEENNKEEKHVKIPNLNLINDDKKELKTKNINGIDKFYEISGKYGECPMIPNIVGDYNKDFELTFKDIGKIINLDEVQRLTKTDVLNARGVNNTNLFEPKRGITRAEFLAIVLKVHCYDISKKPKNLPFYDVDLDTWQARVVKVANEIGIIKGYESDKNGIPFKPNKNISKIEAFAIMMKMREIEILEDYRDKYVDKKADWQTKPLSAGEYLGILRPKEINYKFYPNSVLSRDEMVKIIVDIVRLY